MSLETRNNNMPSSSSVYLGEEALSKIITAETPHILIPRSNLFGIQAVSEYSSTKRKCVENGLAKQGIDLLLAYPILTCAVIQQGKATLYIVDGHHRARYSGRFKISHLPCLAITPSELTLAINQERGYTNEDNLTEDALLFRLRTDSAEAIASFKSLQEYKNPRIISGVSTIQELTNRFPTFTRGAILSSAA